MIPVGEAGNGDKRTDTRTPVAAVPAGWGFELPPRWRLERLLGQGGQAEVWLAMDERLGELVAVKIFHPAVSPAALGRLRREVRLGRSLQHSNLVRIYELIEAGGRLALAMEWLPQGNLAAKLERDGPLATGEVVAVAQQVLVALEHLQAHGVVHRDIKPSNLLLDAQGRVKVGDLGLVKVAEDGEHLTQTATTVGSPGYMSPEQIRGQDLTPASDLYSLGVTLFHLLTGQPPFSGTSNFEVAHAHIEQAAPGAFDTDLGFVMEKDGSSLFAVYGKRYTVDRWGNPSTGPNAGRDLMALRIGVVARSANLVATANSGDRELVLRDERTLLEDAAPLLVERPYRAVIALYSARAYAQIGDLTGGIDLLRSGWQATANDSLGLALGHLQAIAGDLAGAEATLRKNRADGVTPAGHFRTTQLMTRVAIEWRDRAALENAIADWPAVEPAGAQAELRARADLWWDDLHDEDCEVRSFDTAPDGEAVACLARWRLGKTRPMDPEAMADAAKRNPDAAMECDLARAMALLALGRTSAAVQATASVVTYLKPRCAYDFMLYQLLELARACNAKALLAAGRRDEAIREAELLHASLRPGLLPAILVGEVLRGGAAGPAGR